MAMTYSQYLKVGELLELQKPQSEGKDHDEWLFITIHQVYELWFKQLLTECDFLVGHLRQAKIGESMATIKRVLTIFKTLVSQVDILETMTPLSFASFRNLLGTSSGFQSAQFREFEALLGMRDHKKLSMLPADEKQTEAAKRRATEPTLYDALLQCLAKRGYAIPADVLSRDHTTELPANAHIQTELLKVYRNDQELAQICERLVDLDEGVQEWRYRHVKMVERTIGFKMGTGGSPGVEYLKTTIFKPCFPDLWAIRSEF